METESLIGQLDLTSSTPQWMTLLVMFAGCFIWFVKSNQRQQQRMYEASDKRMDKVLDQQRQFMERLLNEVQAREEHRATEMMALIGEIKDTKRTIEEIRDRGCAHGPTTKRRVKTAL